MLKLIDIECSIGERTLFSKVSLNVNAHDRVGLVGANGTGKTTLLRIINAEISPTQGFVSRTKNLRIGYLPQEEIVLHGNTLIDEVLKDYNFHLKELTKIRKLVSEEPHAQKLLKEYEKSEDDFHRIGGYDYEADAHKVINGLGFVKDDYKKLVQEFSSGWQMRIVLARLLLNKPDLLLFDEPTNHLDIESIQWLENYLQNFKGALIIVSHDRYFLDKILQTTTGTFGIWELDYGKLRRYRTNYTGYLHEAQVHKQRLIQMAKTQEKRIVEIKDFIARNKANKSKAGIVKSREKYLDRLERVEVESERSKIKAHFPVATVHTKRLVELSSISKVYDNRSIFKNISLVIENRDKIAFVGKNGAGKSTLCRIVAGFEDPSTGERKVSEKLKISAFSHELLLGLDPANTVYDEIAKDSAEEVHQSIRKFLGLMLFSGDDIFKKISVLSGGEKTRLVILKAMIAPSNLLILDEPTYHLDKESIDAIKQAINSYDGTIILVTHDRDLITSFANRILELKNGNLHDYPGDFSYYLWKRKAPAETIKEKQKSNKIESATDRLRHQILGKEDQRNKLRVIFTKAGIIDNPRKAKKLFEEYQKLTEEIDDLENKLAAGNI